MYENRYPFVPPSRPARPLGAAGEGPAPRGCGGGALRALAWHELTARLSAARDLRTVLREDARARIAIDRASFTDAAASYFRTLGLGEPAINPAGIEEPKACGGTKGERNMARADGTDGGNRALPEAKGERVREESMGETNDD